MTVAGLAPDDGNATACALPQLSRIGDPYFPDDGNTGYDVADYDVRIAYDPARPDLLKGDTTITARALRSLDRLSLDLKGFFDAWAHGTTIPPKEYLYPGTLADGPARPSSG
ncbi:hypothetical protein ABTZ03_36880 [Kitasatospora sp. NPDC096077]|uniref:hypothetical protein n=1 Tax=Kitasatospora sp. NPDC096077 TaxID=3155544 RepID=UPI003317A4C2